MKTIITLTYFDAPKETNPFMDAICGPLVFASEDAAKDVLFQYVAGRVKSDDYNALMLFKKDYADTLQSLVNDLSNKDDILSAIQLDTELKSAFINVYFKYANEDIHHAGYMIKEVPTETFLDQLNRSKKIEIDGSTFDYIDLHNPDVTLSLDDILLSWDSNEHDPEGDALSFTLGEAQNATYDTTRNVWLVGNHRIKVLPLYE